MEGCYVNQRQIVNEKLLILRQQKQDVSKHVDKVLTMGNAWIAEGDQRPRENFAGMCHLIENTSLLVAHVCSQMAVPSYMKEFVSMKTAAMKEAGMSVLETVQRGEDSVSQQEHSIALITELKEDMNKMREEHYKTVAEMNKRLNDLEEAIHDLVKFQPEDNTSVGSEGKKIETHEDDKKRLDDQLSKLMMEVENLQRNVIELTTQVGCLPSLQQKATKQDKMLSVLSAEEGKHKELLENLSGKVTSNSDAVINIACQQEKQQDMLSWLEREMEEVQNNIDLALKKIELASIDEEARERKHAEMLHPSTSTLSPSTSTLSLQESTSGKIGFAAKLSGEWFLKKTKMAFVKKGNVLTFADVICNWGSVFDPVIGKFTAPRGGAYVVCLTMHQFNDGHVTLHVTKQPSRCRSAESSAVYSHKYCILQASTSEDLGSDCLLTFVEMKAGDNLYVTAAEVEGNPSLTDSTVFSCFLLA